MKTPQTEDIIKAFASTPSERWKKDTLIKLRRAVRSEDISEQSEPMTEKLFHWLRKILSPKVYIPVGVLALLALAIRIADSTTPESFLYPLDQSMEKIELAFAGGESAVADVHLRHAAERIEEIRVLVEHPVVANLFFSRAFAASDETSYVDDKTIKQVEFVVDAYEVSLKSVEEIFEDITQKGQEIENVHSLAAKIFLETSQFEKDLLSIQEDADILLQVYIESALSDTEELRDATLGGVIHVMNNADSDVQELVKREMESQIAKLEQNIHHLDELLVEKEETVSLDLLVEAETLLLSATENFHQAKQKVKENNFSEAFNALDISEECTKQVQGILTAQDNAEIFHLKALEMLEDMEQEIQDAKNEISTGVYGEGEKAAERLLRLQSRLSQAQQDLYIVQQALFQNDINTILETVGEIQNLTDAMEDLEITPYERERLAEASLIQTKAKIASLQSFLNFLPKEEQSTLEQKREMIQIRRMFLEAQEAFRGQNYSLVEEKIAELENVLDEIRQ